jgi:hypothetical protein
MMRYIVLYAADCPACSKVAAMVTDASITGLEARGFEDPEIAESLRNAGLEIPDRPSLVIMSGTDVQVLSGLAMRRRLAGVAGWRRSRTIVRLLAAEWRARLTKSAASRLPSRRGVIGGIVAGITGWAVTSGVANAPPASAGTAPGMKPADPADAARVLRTATAQRAIRAWGPADAQVHEISGGGSHPVFVLMHSDRDIYTFIDNSPGALRGNKPVALSLGAAPTAEHALRYYTVDGAALADLQVPDGKVTARAFLPHSGQAAPDVVPGIKSWQFACWLGCIGRRTASVACAGVCEQCFYYAVGTVARLIACSNCLVCAGPNGVKCLMECSII